MLKAVITKEFLQDALDAIMAIVTESRIFLSEAGMEFKAIDPASVAAGSVRIEPAAFEFYQATPGEIGVDLERLSDMLSTAERGERVRLELLEAERKLRIGIGSLSYTLGLIDPGVMPKEPRIPELDLPAYVVLPGAELRRVVKAAEIASDHVVMSVEDDVFCVEARGDVESLRAAMPRSELLDMKPGKARSIFSLDYLSDMSRPIGKAQAVKLELGVDYPMRISFWLNNVHVSYILAPRIEEE